MKVIVSACLLGEACRYDGCSKAHPGVLAFLRDKEIVPFCPEAPVLGTPRGRISVVVTEAYGLRVKQNADGTDVTDRLLGQTEQIINAHKDAGRIILKSKSPSCGIGSTPIMDRYGCEVGRGNGIAAQRLIDFFGAEKLCDEYTYGKDAPPA